MELWEGLKFLNDVQKVSDNGFKTVFIIFEQCLCAVFFNSILDIYVVNAMEINKFLGKKIVYYSI